jgi:Zn-dependent protease/CBS domain-containing protein
VRWSFPLGRVFGIPIRVHATFFLLLVFVYFVFAQRSQSQAAGLFAVLLTCILFVCVVAHELGHSMAARLFGTRTRGIVLLPIGGVALLEQIPREPYKEIVIALAGPLVSAVLAGLFLAVALALDFRIVYDLSEVSAAGLVTSLFWINVLLICFNLIPAFPMDGGRVFRAFLSLTFGWERGTRWAALLGQIVAVLFVVASFVLGGHWGLLLIGFFIFFGAGEEGRIAQLRTSLEGARVEHAMIRSFATLSPDETLLKALVKTIQHDQTDFPVLEQGRLAGMVTHEQLLEGTRRYGLDAAVRLVTPGDFFYTSPEADLESLAMEILRQSRTGVPVLKGERLVGMLSWEQLHRFGQIRRRVRTFRDEQKRRRTGR